MHDATATTEKTVTKRDGDVTLARHLVSKNLLTQQQAKSLLTRLKEESDKTISFEDLVVEEQMVDPETLIETKAALLNIPYIDLSNYEVDPEVLELIPADVAREFQLFPLFRIDGTLLLAMTNPKDVKAIDKVTRLTQLDVSPALSSNESVQEAIDKYYGSAPGISAKVSNEELQDILEVIEAEEGISEEDQQSTQDLERLAEEAPVVKMTNMVLTQSIVDGASDIHINPEEDQLRIRFRVDGVLRDSFSLPASSIDAMISRIKILSSLDIAEKRVPQDGQMRLRLSDGREIDIRVSTLPSSNGENVVLRILDKSAALLNLENLGFEEDVHQTLLDILSSAYGIMLVTGPTGSGKTTTLYAGLNHLNTVEKNIITLEDPVEYRLPLIRQSQVNIKAGMTFAKGLKAILRQDPDIVMLGEIRDGETANIAVQAALTGHLVLSTLHTNDAAGAVTRLGEMGIEPFLVSSAVRGILAQRLVRKICPDCREEYEADQEVPEAVRKQLGIGPSDPLKFYKGKGCKNCRDTGYRGRISLIEILKMNDALKNAILQNKSLDDIRDLAVKSGMRTLVQDGWIKILKGHTTFEEVMRVTNVD